MNEQIYEINVKRFIQSTEFQLRKLCECVKKINEFQTYEDWRNVKQAQQNGSQIIKRIRSDIKEILKIRLQIVEQLNDKSSSQIVNKIDDQLKDISKRVEHQASEIDSIHAPYYTYELKNQDYMLQTGCIGMEPFQYELKKNDTLAKEKDLCDAYNQLQKDCEDLQTIMQTFSNEIFAQKPTIDSIESNIIATQSNVNVGASSLREALNYKVFTTAAGGAMIGTMIGGPVGFLAGAKLGAVAGLGSGVIGFFVAKKLRSPETL